MPSVPPARTLWATHKVSLSSPSEHCMIAWPIACRKESPASLAGCHISVCCHSVQIQDPHQHGLAHAKARVSQIVVPQVQAQMLA